MMSLSEWEAELKCSATGKPGELFRMPTCHNGLFYTDEGLCPKRLYIF